MTDYIRECLNRSEKVFEIMTKRDYFENQFRQFSNELLINLIENTETIISSVIEDGIYNFKISVENAVNNDWLLDSIYATEIDDIKTIYFIFYNEDGEEWQEDVFSTDSSFLEELLRQINWKLSTAY